MNKNEIAIAGFTAILLLLLFYVFQSVLAFLCISAVLALLGSPIVKFYQKLSFKKLIINKGVAAFLTLFTFYGIIGIVFVLLFPVLSKEVQNITNINPDRFILAAEKPIQQAENLITQYTHQSFSFENYIKEKLMGLLNLSTLSSSIEIITSITSNLLVYFFSISFITYFFLKDGRFFFEKTLSLLPKKYQNEVPGVMDKIKNKLSQYVLGILIQVAVLFLCLSLGLYFIGVENYLLFAFLGAVLNIIPYLGTLIAMVLTIVISVVSLCSGLPDCFDGLLPMIVKILIVFGITQSIDNLLLQPFIFSKSVNAHPLEIFLVVIISGNFYGIIGMILAIPVYSSLKIIFWEIRKNSKFLNSIYNSGQ